MFIFLVNILVPIIAGVIYFLMAAEIKRVSAVRKIMFGELGYQKVFLAFVLFGIYFITRPLQNIIGPYPWPTIINCARQFFLMAFISPAILVGIWHWVSHGKEVTKSSVFAAYTVGSLMAIIFILVNAFAIDGSKVLATVGSLNIYDATWFSTGPVRPELMLIHLIAQLISPVGFLIMAAAYVRHQRYNYPLSTVYNLMPLKWKYLEAGLLIFAGSLLVAGISAFVGQYYTYLWVIYFLGAIVAGLFELKSIKLPPRQAPADLRDEEDDAESGD
jgi:hypothetical protein